MKNLFPSFPDDATLAHVYQAFPAKLAPLTEYQNAVMRGPSDLSVGERELIAAYVSGLNACAFCHGAHTLQARAFGIEPAVIDALMTDVATAPVEARLKPILSYVAKLTLTPARMVEADAVAVYAADWSEAALFDAIQVCGLFNLMNRMLEGAGITEYHTDPATADDADLDRLRGTDTYVAFARLNGVGTDG